MLDIFRYLWYLSIRKNKEVAKMKRYWDDKMGWGDVLNETEHFMIVRFDADPWYLVQVPKS